MPQRTRAQRLNGLFPLSYTGVIPVSPVNFVIDDRPPTINDSKNFYIGDLWLDKSTEPTEVNNLWMLVSLAGYNATWVNFGAGDLESLTGNSGGPVFPDPAGNIDVVGDGTTIDIVGNPGTNTLTVSTVGSGVVNSLTGNSGGAVFPTAGNIDVLGTGVITVVGNPGTSTLTVTPSGDIASSFITNPATGTAIPAAGVLTFAGTNGVTVSAAGSTVTISGPGSGFASSFPTDSGTATPAAGVVNVLTQNATLGAGSSVLFSAPGASNTIQLDLTDSDDNTILGQGSGSLTLTGINNTVLGQGSFSAVGAGSASNNIIIGKSAGNNLTGSESRNILVNDPGVTGLSGFIAINIPDTGGGNGFNLHNYPGDLAANGSNIFIGRNAGNRTLNTGVGGAIANLGFGDQTLVSLTDGDANITHGNTSGFAITTGDNNTLIGHVTGYNDLTMLGLTTGSNNIAVGYTAGTDWSVGSESNNIAIGMGAGNSGDNLTIRIGGKAGLNPVQTRCFIEGIRGRTTDVNDAIPVLIDSLGQLGTTSSSMRYKSNIEPMGSVSDRLMELEPVTFSWKSDQNYTQQIGLIAEQVDKVMPELVVYDKEGQPETVKYHELPVLILNELQKLADKVRELEERIEELENI